MKDIKIEDVDFNNLELVVSYYFDKKSQSIVSVRPLKDDEVPDEVKEHFRKLGYIK